MVWTVPALADGMERWMPAEEIKSDICLDINVLSLSSSLILSPCCFVAIKRWSINCGLWPPEVVACLGWVSPLSVSSIATEWSLSSTTNGHGLWTPSPPTTGTVLYDSLLCFSTQHPACCWPQHRLNSHDKADVSRPQNLACLLYLHWE